MESAANLSNAVRWARDHDEEAQRIADAGHARIRQVVSVPGVYAYVDRLIQGYAKKYAEHGGGRGGDENVVGNYTHEFKCRSAKAGETVCSLDALQPV